MAKGRASQSAGEICRDQNRLVTDFSSHLVLMLQPISIVKNGINAPDMLSHPTAFAFVSSFMFSVLSEEPSMKGELSMRKVEKFPTKVEYPFKMLP